MQKTIIIFGAVGIALTSTAAAQTASRSAQSPANAQPVFGTADMFQRSQGSLLQASITQRPAEQQGKPASYSTLAVPEPEPHVFKKHDIVNIIVNEEQKSASAGNTDLQRAADFDAKTDAFVKFNAARFSLLGGAEGANPPEIKLEGTRDFKGQAQVDRTDTVTMRLGAEVVDVRPNGTMVVVARQHIQFDAEEVNITLTGICRVQDVDAANSILSTDMHDLDFNKQTKGAVHDTTRRGFLERLLDFLSPF
jgi:flagellar L-ring protein precursor FlgH